MAITFNNFDFDDGVNYIVTSDNEIEQPELMLEVSQIANRDGSVTLGTQRIHKIISVEGVIFADTLSEFRSKVDALKVAVNVGEATLQFTADRSYTATLQTLKGLNENVTTTPYTMEFLVKSGFAEGSLLTTTYTITSGMPTLSGSITISGTTAARPTISYTAPTATGTTLLSGVRITNTITGKFVTWSGTGTNLAVNYSSSVLFNYDNLTVTANAINSDWIGIMDTWAVGSNAFTVGFTGRVPGGTITVSYNPLYL